jgi:hypothetical protein
MKNTSLTSTPTATQSSSGSTLIAARTDDFQKIVDDLGPSAAMLKTARNYTASWTGKMRKEDLDKGVAEGKITPEERKVIDAKLAELSKLNTVLQNPNEDADKRSKSYDNILKLIKEMAGLLNAKGVELRIMGPNGPVTPVIPSSPKE